MFKKYWVYGLLIASLAFFVYKKFIYKPKTIDYKIVKLSNGWGYNILENNKVFISQTTIPAAKGYQVFKTEKDAQVIANLVVQKMLVDKKGMPNITLEDLDSCKIEFDK